MIFVFLSGFDYISIGVSCFFNLVILLAAYAFFTDKTVEKQRKYKDEIMLISKLKDNFLMNGPQRRLRQLGMIYILLIIITFAIGMPLIFEGICICEYDSTFGYSVEGDVSYFSTKMIRKHHSPAPHVCDPDSICHVYATLPEETYNSVFINVHVGINIKDVVAYLINKHS